MASKKYKRIPFDRVKQIWEEGDAWRERAIKRLNYMEGKQAILTINEKTNPEKTKTGQTRERKVYNLLPYIKDTHTTFLTKNPINISINDSRDHEEHPALGDWEDTRDYNDLVLLDAKALESCLVTGRYIEVAFFDERRHLIRGYDPLLWWTVNNNDRNQGDVIFAVYRFEHEKNSFFEGDLVDEDFVEWVVYDDVKITTYYTGGEYDAEGSHPSDAEREPSNVVDHGFGACPVLCHKINDNGASFFKDSLLALQDGYNRLQNGLADEVLYNSDAFLVLYGVDSEKLEEHPIDKSTGKENPKTYGQLMMELGMLCFAGHGEHGGQSAEFIQKGNEVPKWSMGLDETKTMIWLEGAVPNTDKILGTTGNVSGLALRLKMLVTAAASSLHKRWMQTNYKKRIDFFNRSQTRIKDKKEILEGYVVIINEDIPENEVEIMQALSYLRGIMPIEAMLERLPSITNPSVSYEQLLKELKDLAAIEAEKEISVAKVATADAQKGLAGNNNNPKKEKQKDE